MSKLERYDSYKDSGVEWLKEVPMDWKMVRLGTLGKFSASGIDKYLVKNESIVKIINFTDIYSRTNLTLDSKISYMEVTTPELNRKKHLVKKGDLIFLPSSETFEDLGLSALVNEELENTSFSYHLIRLEFEKDIEHNYRKYLSNNNSVLNQFSSYGKGTTRKIIGRSVFKNIRVLIPSKQEQIKIASFLDTKTEQLDKAIKQKEQLIELLKERKQIVINDAVTKGVDKTVTMKDSGVEWIGEIPEHWEIVKSKRLFMARKERARKSDLQLTASQKHGVIYQKDYMELEGRKVTQVETNYEILKRVEPNDFLISMRSFQGGIEYCRYEGSVSSAYVPLIPIKDVVSEYFKYLFKSYVYIQALASTSNLVRDGQALRFDNFSLVDLIIIPEHEQENIAKYLDEETVKIDKSISLQEKQITKLKEYKTTLIDSVVTGKVRVR